MVAESQGCLAADICTSSGSIPQLLRIEEELGENAVYAGESWRHIGW